MKRTNRGRARNAWKAARICSGNKDDLIEREDVIDVLTDVRHLCDMLQLDYSELDRVAHGHYTFEVVEERAAKRKKTKGKQ